MRSFDRHSRHAPVAGKVLDARLIEGQGCLEVETTVNDEGVVGLTADEETGYRFVHIRG